MCLEENSACNIYTSDENELLGTLSVSVYAFCQKTVVNKKTYCTTIRCLAGSCHDMLNFLRSQHLE